MAKKKAPYRKKEKKFDVIYEKVLNIVLIVLGAALAVLLLVKGGTALWQGLHLDGSLPIKQQAVVAEENWLVKNTGTSIKPHCFKFGEVGEIEGYTRNVTESTNSYHYDQGYTFTAEDPDNAVDAVNVAITTGGIDEIPQKARDLYTGMLPGCEMSDLQEETWNGRTAKWFSYNYTNEESGEPEYGLVYYVDATKDNAVFVLAYDKQDADLRAAVDQVLNVLTIGK